MKISGIIKKNLFSFLIIILIFSIDRISKNLILIYFDSSIYQNIHLTSFLNLNLIWNEGIAFGLMKFEQKYIYNFISFFIIIVLIILTYIASKKNGLEKIGYLMILGGGLGNIFDRLLYRSVIDFIDIHYNNFHWFIFNIADIFITAGVVILIGIEFKFSKKND